MAEQTVQSVERCFALLEQLASGGRLGVSELSRLTGLHKATVHRLLQTLLELRYVRQEPDGRYELSLKLVRLSSGLLERKDLPRRMHPYLVRLAEETGETVHLVQREGSRIVYLDKVESDRNAVRMVSRVGMVRDMPCTAVEMCIRDRWVITQNIRSIRPYGKGRAAPLGIAQAQWRDTGIPPPIPVARICLWMH